MPLSDMLLNLDPLRSQDTQQPRGMLADLLDKIRPDQRALLFGSTPGGAATINPFMLMRSPQILELLRLLMANNPNAPRSDSAIPQRNIIEVPPQPFGNIGINAWPFPGARLPNAYRGPLTQPGIPGTPDAPEYYVPGFADQRLRGT